MLFKILYLLSLYTFCVFLVGSIASGMLFLTKWAHQHRPFCRTAMEYTIYVLGVVDFLLLFLRFKFYLIVLNGALIGLCYLMWKDFPSYDVKDPKSVSVLILVLFLSFAWFNWLRGTYHSSILEAISLVFVLVWLLPIFAVSVMTTSKGALLPADGGLTAVQRVANHVGKKLNRFRSKPTMVVRDAETVVIPASEEVSPTVHSVDPVAFSAQSVSESATVEQLSMPQPEPQLDSVGPVPTFRPQ